MVITLYISTEYEVISLTCTTHIQKKLYLLVSIATFHECLMSSVSTRCDSNFCFITCSQDLTLAEQAKQEKHDPLWPKLQAATQGICHTPF